MLNNATVKAARPRATAYKLADGQGLYLHVLPTGAKSWRMRCRFASTGGETTLTFGTWPLIDLAGARARRDDARAQLARGEDPRAPRANLIRTVEQAARAWMKHHASGWSPRHAVDVAASLERDILPAIGAELLDAIEKPRVLELLREIEARGSIATGRRVRVRLEGIFALAMAEGWTKRVDNPADVGEGLARLPAGGRQPALVDVVELRGLVIAVDQASASPTLRLASALLALTAVRLAALRGMRWGEVADLEGPAPIWTVPAARMKLGVDRKLDAANDHDVPLSPPAVAVLRMARALAGGRPDPAALVFVGRGGEEIGDDALRQLYARVGYGGRHVPHGWRAAFSTVMNERLGGKEDAVAIERTLGHVPKGMSKVERAYNRSRHLPRRRELLEEWGTLIAPTL